MSGADVASRCPEAQAEKVIEYINLGWDADEPDKGGDVLLKRGNERLFVQPNGSTFPR